MKREDLIELSQRELHRQARRGALTFALFLVWMLGLFIAANVFPDRLQPEWLFVPILITYTSIPIVAVFTMARKVTNRLPRCPHCGIRFTRLLLPIAIATGNCGHCGRSIEG